MLHLPQLVLIGATGRNVGKTEFAVRLVRRLAASGPVAAAKITVIRERGACPHGGSGCGACQALGSRPYLLDEEHGCGVGKDTHRLREAGAGPVWWLRVELAALAEGLAALAARFAPGVPVVAESNAARQAVEPGLFVVIRDDGPVKPSCQAVLPFADAEIRRVGDDWDVGVERLRWADGAWSLPEEAGAILLAGGASRRMGRDKALLPWGGQPLIAHIAGRLRRCCAELCISANDPGRFAFLGVPVVPDREPGAGPLMGLAAGLAAARHERNLLYGCDMPHPPLPLVRRMLAQASDVDAVVPCGPDGRPEPLCAVYRRSCLPAAEAALAAGRRRMTDLLDAVRVRWVDAVTPPANLNTPADYQAACAEAL